MSYTGTGYDLNPMRYPTIDELPSLGLCPTCLNDPPARPVCEVPAFTDDDIDEALDALEG
jgi:hypothetical protein